MSNYLVLCASLLALGGGGGEARPQDALIACKSKTIQSHFGSLEDCFSYYSQIEPRVKNTAVQKALLNTLLQLEEIEDLLDIEEKILESSIANGEKQDPEVNQRRKRDLDSILGLLGLGGDGGGGLPGIDDLLRGLFLLVESAVGVTRFGTDAARDALSQLSYTLRANNPFDPYGPYTIGPANTGFLPIRKRGR